MQKPCWRLSPFPRATTNSSPSTIGQQTGTRRGSPKPSSASASCSRGNPLAALCCVRSRRVGPGAEIAVGSRSRLPVDSEDHAFDLEPSGERSSTMRSLRPRPRLDFRTDMTHGPGPCVCWYIGGFMTMREFKRGQEPLQAGCRRRAIRKSVTAARRLGEESHEQRVVHPQSG